jgi:hypothetical protein
MPTKSRREDALIKLFLSAYDDDRWTNCTLDWLDQQHDGAVEVRATCSDGRTLAIEHTLIEFFSGERQDLERFKPFLAIEQDQSLSVPGKIIYVNVPRGVLDGLKPKAREQIVGGVNDWLRANIRSLPTGRSMQPSRIAASDGLADTEVVLQCDVTAVPNYEGQPPLIRRYGNVNVGETVEKALRAKLPKLVKTAADMRILLLERSQWTLSESDIHAEIEKRRAAFPALAHVDVWFVETVFYDTSTSDGFRGYAEFKRYVNGEQVETIAFNRGRLFSRSKDGMPLPIPTPTRD